MLGGPAMWFGNQFSLEFPFSFVYLIPSDQRAGHAFRFRMGMAPSLEINLTSRFQLGTLIGALLPEIGLAVVREAGLPASMTVYWDLARIPFTYWISSKEAIRFRFAQTLGLRLNRHAPSENRKVRTVWGMMVTAAFVYR